MEISQIIETWNINNRVNLYLLDSIEEEHLADVPLSKGRNAGSQFAHLHNVRLMWLKAADPKLLAAQNEIGKKAKITKKLLSSELTKSAKAMGALLENGFKEGRIKNFKPHPAAFFGYMLSHESHHRGQILLALKQSGHPVNKKILYGLWEWGSR